VNEEQDIGPEAPPPIEICIVMLSTRGDAVHVLPVVNALKSDRKSQILRRGVILGTKPPENSFHS